MVYAAFNEHMGIYPEHLAIEHFKKELSAYSTSKGAIRFPINKPIPFDLIKKMVKFRIM